MLYPLTFHPILKERVWGGRKLDSLYGKKLPPVLPVGESWEISDRPGDASVIANGPFAGKDLRWLMERHGEELLGAASAANGRFPLLIKILDAQDTLSLQVHPPAQKAIELMGEPKTEMWYIADAAPHSELFVGLKRGVTREEFENKLRSGSVAECFHRVRVASDEAMFLPSGRVHALGAGLVIFEIQQNSDTTYRVFDWNRKGLDGKPRDLHIHQGLASIDFDDFEPALVSKQSYRLGDAAHFRPLVDDALFKVDLITTDAPASITLGLHSSFQIIGLVDGKALVASPQHESVELSKGGFCLIPARLSADLWLDAGSKALMVNPGVAHK
jgi:mannose-6-phosphate isomerase